jgi:hypothetical protein
MKHLDEEQVQRLLHGELTRALEITAGEHLAVCAPCRERVAVARREESEVHALLAALDHDPPRIRAGAIVSAARARASAWRRRAAGLLVAMGAAGAAYALPGSPLPGWVSSVVERIGSLADTSSRSPAVPPPAGPETPPDPRGSREESSGGIAVAPGNTLLILFTRSQGEGGVLVSLSDGEEVRVLAPAGAATFTSDVNQLVIDNPGSTATFEIAIPRHAPRVEVRVAGKKIFLKDGPHISAGTEASGDSYSLPLSP